jgi:uncharacterized lipoprotein YmbA
MSRILFGALVFVSGCFKLARPTPPLEQFVLGSNSAALAGSSNGAATPRVVAGDSTRVTIGLRRLDLAPYLATTAIVVRRGAVVETSGTRRWAEEPAAGISRAIAGYLGASPRVLAVDIAPWPIRAPHDYLVQVHITHLEGVAADDSLAQQGDMHLQASWEIIRTLDGALLARGKTERRESGWTIGDYRGLVARFEKGLSGLADDITTCMARLSPVVPVTAVTEGVRAMECTK